MQHPFLLARAGRSRQKSSSMQEHQIHQNNETRRLGDNIRRLPCHIREGVRGACVRIRGIQYRIFLCVVDECQAAEWADATYGPACSTASHVIKKRTRIQTFTTLYHPKHGYDALTERETPSSQS